jgi:DNA-binding CsgD family transcriptional regulator
MNEAIILNNLLKSNLVGLGSILKNLYYYSKNVNSQYLDCNEATANKLNLVSLKDIKGKNDNDFGWSKERIHFLRKHDLEVLKSRVASGRIERQFTTTSGNTLQLMSYKTPLFVDDKLVGISGFSLDFSSIHLSDNNKTQEFMLSLRKKFSCRESEVLFHLARGKSARDISQKLNLSKRTVESYLNNIKSKTGVSTKSELIEKIIDGFI